jgi:methylenetetrahydrofolate--tRNA-(uracil-5-)-methyltransferase
LETIDAGPRSFQPMNVNFGLFPPLATSPNRGPDGERLRGTAKALAKRRALTARALADLAAWRGGAAMVAEAHAVTQAAEQAVPLVPASHDAGVPEPHRR